MQINPRYCSACGAKILADVPTFPHRCVTCGRMIYKPIPTVAAVIVPLLDAGVSTLLCVRRIVVSTADVQTEGPLALPGGFQLSGETWQQAAARETLEETGVQIDEDTITLWSATTVEDGSLNLIIGVALPVPIPLAFSPDGVEVSEVVAITKPVTTAFPVHDEAIAAFFDIKLNDPLPAMPAYVPDHLPTLPD